MARIGDFLQVGEPDGVDAMIFARPGGLSGAACEVATLRDAGQVSLDTLLAHARV
jgi:hypothetical protein